MDHTKTVKATRWPIIALYSVTTVIIGAGYNATFVEMGQKMPAYPMFLLYTATIIQVVFFGCGGLWGAFKAARGGQNGGSLGLSFLLPRLQGRLFCLGLLAIVNGLFTQFADPHVDGDLQNVLNQVGCS